MVPVDRAGETLTIASPPLDIDIFFSEGEVDMKTNPWMIVSLVLACVTGFLVGLVVSQPVEVSAEKHDWDYSFSVPRPGEIYATRWDRNAEAPLPGTFDVELAEEPLPNYTVKHQGETNEAVQGLEKTLAILFENGKWFSDEAEELRKVLGGLAPNHPMLENKAEESPKRPKFLANPSRWLVKWSKGAEGELRLQRLEPGGYGSPEDLDYWTLAQDAREQFDAEAQRYLAADFPVIFTEPGSLEETVQKLKSGTIDVSKSFKMSPGWKRNDPQKPQDENQA